MANHSSAHVFFKQTTVDFFGAKSLPTKPRATDNKQTDTKSVNSKKHDKKLQHAYNYSTAVKMWAH